MALACTPRLCLNSCAICFAFQARLHELIEARQSAREMRSCRHDMMKARREEEERTAVRATRQSAWMVLIALAARASLFESIIEPQRRLRQETAVALRLQAVCGATWKLGPASVKPRLFLHHG